MYANAYVLQHGEEVWVSEDDRCREAATAVFFVVFVGVLVASHRVLSLVAA